MLSLRRTKTLYVRQQRRSAIRDQRLEHEPAAPDEAAQKNATDEGVEVARVTLKRIRLVVETDRVSVGNETITNATGHSSDRTVKQVYDRRKTKTATATE